jgi:hypothetical protein
MARRGRLYLRIERLADHPNTPMQFASRADAIAEPGDVRVHYKGGVYRKLAVITCDAGLAAGDTVELKAWAAAATVTDPVQAGTPMALYEHLYPHEYRYYLRPDAMFEGALEVEGAEVPRFKPAR